MFCNLIWKNDPETTKDLLGRRHNGKLKCVSVDDNNVSVEFCGSEDISDVHNSVHKDEFGNIIAWDGKLDISTELLLQKIFNSLDNQELFTILSYIKRPFAFILWHQLSMRLFFGRDMLGRKSLLGNLNQIDNANIILSTLGNQRYALSEIPVLGIYCVSLNSQNNKLDIFLHPWQHKMHHNFEMENYILKQTILSPIVLIFNDCLPNVNEFLLDMDLVSIYQQFNKDILEQFWFLLTEAIKKACMKDSVAVLFSGGIDSAILAAAAHHCLSSNQPLDLLNISFIKNKDTLGCDRINARNTCLELQSKFQNRVFNLIEIDVNSRQLKEQRQKYISQLILPNKTVLDDSIGCAFWFCAQGQGSLQGSSYNTFADFLIVGTGADEQLCGYLRHRKCYEHGSWSAVINEIKFELDRIPYRNLGRDDRVLSDSGRIPVYPFLDLDVVAYLSKLPMWLKANLNYKSGFGDKLLLRLLAYHLGLNNCCSLIKKAIQFGSNIAKFDCKKEKGSDICSRLHFT